MEKLLRVNFDLSLPPVQIHPKAKKGQTISLDGTDFKNVSTDRLDRINAARYALTIYSAKCNDPKVLEAQRVIKQAGCKSCQCPKGILVRYTPENEKLLDGLRALGASITYIKEKNVVNEAVQEVQTKKRLISSVVNYLKPIAKRLLG